MSTTEHCSFQIDLANAKRSLTQLDWPGGTKVSVEAMSSKQVWLPFNNAGSNLLDPQRYASLAPVQIPENIRNKRSPKPSKPPGTHLPATSDQKVIFMPFYLFKEPNNSSRWALVEGLTGLVCAGKLTAHRRSAGVRLGLLILLSLFTFFIGSTYAILLLSNIFSLAGPLLLLLQGFKQWLAGGLLIALLMMLLRWMMRKRDTLFEGLKEPIYRFETDLIHLPLDRHWLPLLKALGWVGLILVPMIILSLLALMGAAMTGTGPALNIPAMSIRVLQLFAALAFGKAALRLSRGEGLPQTIGFAPLPSPRPKGPAADMIKVVLSVSLLAMSGMILGYILDLWGAADFLNHQYELDTGMLAGIGARVGAIIGVISSKVSWKERYTVAVGLSAELLFFDWFLDPWIGLPLLLILVAITALWSSQKADANTGEKKTSTWQALRTAWIFVFYGILGGLAGQIIGLVFLGPAGMVVGELLGDSILATTALLILRSENTAQQKKSLQTHRSHKT